MFLVVLTVLKLYLDYTTWVLKSLERESTRLLQSFPGEGRCCLICIERTEHMVEIGGGGDGGDGFFVEPSGLKRGHDIFATEPAGAVGLARERCDGSDESPPVKGDFG